MTMEPNAQHIPYHRQPPPKDVDPPRQRIDVACQRCRRRKIKCSGWSEDQPRCQGCVKADHPCEFVNRVSPIIVPPNAPHSAPGAVASPGYVRPWSPTTPTYGSSPRLHGMTHGNLSAGHRRSTQGYHPYASPQSPTGPPYSPSFTMPWTQHAQSSSPQDVPDSYVGTGFHHLVDPAGSMTRPMRPADVGLESPNMVTHGSLAQRRLQRGESYTYGMDGQGASPLPSPLTIPLGVPPNKGYTSSPSMIPREDLSYGKLMYAPLNVSSSPQLQGSMASPGLQSASPQIQNQSMQSHITQKSVNYSPLSATSQHSQSSQPYTPTHSSHSQTSQLQYQEQPTQSRMHYQDPQPRQQYPQDSLQHQSSQPHYSEFAVPVNLRRPNIAELTTQPTSSMMSYSAPTTQSQQSTQSSQPVDYPTSTGNLTPEYPYARPTDRYPSPFNPELRVTSRPASRTDRTNLTVQTLADHTHVQDNIHEQRIEASKNKLSVDNGNGTQVMEYLDTLPQPTQQRRQGDECNA